MRTRLFGAGREAACPHARKEDGESSGKGKKGSKREMWRLRKLRKGARALGTDYRGED